MPLSKSELLNFIDSKPALVELPHVGETYLARTISQKAKLELAALFAESKDNTEAQGRLYIEVLRLFLVDESGMIQFTTEEAGKIFSDWPDKPVEAVIKHAVDCCFPSEETKKK